MRNRTASTAAAFWQSKLGHAALASVAAMALLVALSSQIAPGAASAAGLAYPISETAAGAEIA